MGLQPVDRTASTSDSLLALGFREICLNRKILIAAILLLLPVCVGLTSATVLQSGSLNVGLVGYWSFDESSGNLAADSSGNGRNGTLVRNPIWTPGISGSALQFNATDNGNDGDDPKVLIGRTFDIAALPFTLTAWVHPDDFADWRAIFSKRDSAISNAMRFDVGLSMGTGQVYVYTGSLVLFSHAPPLGTWTHVAVVASATDTRLYFNGVLQETAAAVALGTSATANTAIGGTGEEGGDNDPFKGTIDELRVYNRTLSALEVLQLWSLATSGIVSVSTTNITTSGATIIWTTSALSDSQIEYGRTESYGFHTTNDPTLTTFHSQSLSGLRANTTYNYRVLSRSTAGMAISANFTFRTAGTTPFLSYTTSFDATENPLTENGAWSNGQLDGFDWNNVQTGSGTAYATNFSAGSDDSIAVLNTQSFASDQYAQGTVRRVPGYSPGVTHEVELLLRFQITPNSARGYEVLWGHDGDLQVVRWNGLLSDFTPLSLVQAAPIGLAVDGDVLRAEIEGSVIKVYKNGTLVATASDTTFVDGPPGIGFFPRPGATLSSYGWKAFEAGNLGDPKKRRGQTVSE